jgi:rhodanese-related sulfurtransferase
VRKILLEGLLVAAIGAALAFVANALSPRGLKLNRDYFHLSLQAQSVAANLSLKPAGPGTNSPAELLAATLKAFGLQLVDSNRVAQLFNDPRRQADLVIFIDARDEDDYQQGHIPAAFEFYDAYRDKYLATVGEACQLAQQIVVYCHGGDECDDSLHAALTLRDLAGVRKENLFVYGGGFTEWCTNGLPVEIGARNSGQLLDHKK